jgi:predicted nucleic acid-binding protein
MLGGVYEFPSDKYIRRTALAASLAAHPQLTRYVPQHSPVTEAELAATCGLLDPEHAQTRRIMEQVVAVIERQPSHRTLATDTEIWREAGILSGTLVRLQGYKSDQRRRVLNDALLFATARKPGCSVLTRNVLDFDFLQQLDPSGKFPFYR